MSEENLTLGAEFAPATEAAWRDLVDKALKGADFEKRLVKRSADGLTIQPLYTSEGAANAPRPAAARKSVPGHMPWDVRARHAHPDFKITNQAILDDLAGGVSSITLGLGPRGMSLTSAADLEIILAGVHLDMIGVTLDGANAAQAGHILDAFTKAKTSSRGGLGLDPLGTLARQSGNLGSSEQSLHEAATLAKRAGSLPSLTTFQADERWVHEAGGTNVQGLAAVLSAAVSYLRAMTKAGLTVENAANQISFSAVADPDLYATIVKLRVLKLLWAQIIATSGGDPLRAPMDLSVETSRRVMTKRDPYVNILRASVAAFGAALGGASAITVLPFTEALGHPTARARRVARNTQVLLAEESNIGRVSDPTAGAWAFENLTAQTARAAWANFQEIEREGGLLAAFKAGSLAAKIKASREALITSIATRKEPITGTSEFPHLDEEPLGVEPYQTGPVPSGDFTPFRLAEPFEAFRDRSDTIKEKPAPARAFSFAPWARPQISLRA